MSALNQGKPIGSLYVSQHLASLLLGQSPALVVLLLLGVLVLGLGGPAWHATRLEWRGHLAQQSLLFLAGLLHTCCSGQDGCPLLSTLAFSSAYWLLAHKEVRWQHALSLQAAQTAVAAGGCLWRLPLASSSEVATTVLCCVAIGLIVPAAVFWDERGRAADSVQQFHTAGTHRSTMGQHDGDKQQQQQQPVTASGHPTALADVDAALVEKMPHEAHPHTTKHEGPPPLPLLPVCQQHSEAAIAEAKLGAGPLTEVPSQTPSQEGSVGGHGSVRDAHINGEELLQVLRDLVAAGLLSPFSVHQQVEHALRLHSHSSSLFEGPTLSMYPNSSASLSSHGPSTRPSTSFSSSSMGLDPATAASSLWLSSAGMLQCGHAVAATASATNASGSSLDCSTPSAQAQAQAHHQDPLLLPLPHLVPMIPRPASALQGPLLPSQPPSPTHAGGSSCTQATQTGHDSVANTHLLPLPVCRHKPAGRSRTPASLLEPPTEGLPPILEAQEGSTQLQQQQQQQQQQQGAEAHTPGTEGKQACAHAQRHLVQVSEEVGTHRTWPPCLQRRTSRLQNCAGHADPLGGHSQVPHCEDSRKMCRGASTTHRVSSQGVEAQGVEAGGSGGRGQGVDRCSSSSSITEQNSEGAEFSGGAAECGRGRASCQGEHACSAGRSSRTERGSRAAECGGGRASSQGEHASSTGRSSTAMEGSAQDLVCSGSGEVSACGRHSQGSARAPPSPHSKHAHRHSSSSPGLAAETAAAAPYSCARMHSERVSEGSSQSVCAWSEATAAPPHLSPINLTHTAPPMHTTQPHTCSPTHAAHAPSPADSSLRSHPHALSPPPPSSASHPGSPRVPDPDQVRSDQPPPAAPPDLNPTCQRPRTSTPPHISAATPPEAATSPLVAATAAGINPFLRALSRSSSGSPNVSRWHTQKLGHEDGQGESELALLREDSMGAWLDQQVQLCSSVQQESIDCTDEEASGTPPPRSCAPQPPSTTPYSPHTPSPSPSSIATTTATQRMQHTQHAQHTQPEAQRAATAASRLSEPSRRPPARAAAAAAAAARSAPASRASSAGTEQREQRASSHSPSSGSSPAGANNAPANATLHVQGGARAQPGAAPAWTGSSRGVGAREHACTQGGAGQAHAGPADVGSSQERSHGSTGKGSQGEQEAEPGSGKQALVQGPTLYPAAKAIAVTSKAFNSSFCFDNPPTSFQHSLRRQPQTTPITSSDPPAGPASASAAAKALLQSPDSRSQTSLELNQACPTPKRNRVVSLELSREQQELPKPCCRGVSLDHHPKAGVLSSRASAPNSRRVSFASQAHAREASSTAAVLRPRSSADSALQGRRSANSALQGKRALRPENLHPQPQQQQQQQHLRQPQQHLQQQEGQQSQMQQQHLQQQEGHQPQVQQSPCPACGCTPGQQPPHSVSLSTNPHTPASPLPASSSSPNEAHTLGPEAGSLPSGRSQQASSFQEPQQACSSHSHEPQSQATEGTHQQGPPATPQRQSLDAGEAQSHEGVQAARAGDAAAHASEAPVPQEPDHAAQLSGSQEPAANRLAAQERSSSSHLKHPLPESMLTNIQITPAKVTDQQPPAQYAGSNTNVVANRKIRPTGDSSELEVENTIISNRRYLDASKALLDEVQVNKILGFGSMGMVYFGILWDTKVVVKMIEHGAGLLGKEQNRGKLARSEAVLSRMLLHPNVVITYDCCTGMMDASRLQVSGTPSRALRSKAGRQRQMTVMVQEFCDAGTLSDALQKRKHGLDKANPAYPELVMQLALDIANGIKYMHSLRVLHMDLKAENILLTHSNSAVAPAHSRLGGLTAKVADLGLALVLSLEDDEVQSGIHGTVSHMPPEAMRNTTFSMATDIYSFGVVLWELITQDKPFAGLKPHQVVEAVCDFNERPSWPKAMDPRLAGLRDLAERCWDAYPRSRPSIFEVIDRLHEVVDPSLAMQRTETGSIGSEISDELELELALRSRPQLPDLVPREKAAEAAQERPATAVSAAAQPPKIMRISSAGHKRRSSLGSRRASSASGGITHAQAEGQKRARGLQDIMAAGPPRDMLSRMLYYLAQVPPLPEQLQRVEVGGGIVRVAAAVDMTNISVRGPR